MKTTIDLTKEQYQILVNALGIASALYSVMADMADKKYQTSSRELDDLEGYILKYAHVVECLEMVEVYNKKRVISEKYRNKQMKDVFEYDEFNFWDTLPRELAKRDLTQKLEEGKHLQLIEVKYRDEFKKHGVERLRIVEE